MRTIVWYPTQAVEDRWLWTRVGWYQAMVISVTDVDDDLFDWLYDRLVPLTVDSEER